MRRKEREVKDFLEIVNIIKNSQYMTASFIDVENSKIPYSVPLNFGIKVDENSQKLNVYFHCAKEGKKSDCLKKNSAVCLTFVQNCFCGSPKDKDENVPCNWTTWFNSAIAKGNAKILTNSSEKREGLDSIMMQNGFSKTGKIPEYPEIMIKKVEVVKIEVSELTGKSHK